MTSCVGAKNCSYASQYPPVPEGARARRRTRLDSARDAAWLRGTPLVVLPTHRGGYPVVPAFHAIIRPEQECAQSRDWGGRA